ncbi:hypothetical protein BH23ACT10_BH23ACT10_27080 [soil metagenome]
MTLRNVIGIATAVVVVGAVLVGGRMLLPPTVGEGSGRPQPDPDIFDPRRERIELPPGYRPSVGRDVIRPIYDPEFVPGDTVDWPADTLVLGVAIDGEAKAYPVNVLNHREMVIDRLRGMPLLVSW